MSSRHDVGRPGGQGRRPLGGLKLFRCGDVVPGCGEVFAGTEETILVEAGAHAQHDHDVDPTDPAVVRAVRDAMRPAR